MNRQILLETLGNLRFLNGVTEKHLEDLTGIARLEEYDEGDVLFAEGEPVDDVYLVIDGEVRSRSARQAFVRSSCLCWLPARVSAGRP